MRWIKRKAVLHGYAEKSDDLNAMRVMACPACDSRFESVVLRLDDIAFADSGGIEALANYCRELLGEGGGVTVGTDRPALRRLLLSGPVAEYVGADRGDELGPGDPYVCPHR